MQLRVLIADFDLFSTVGGGQTFYRAIIEKNPDIDFYYLANKEPAGAPRPANAHPLAYQPHYREHEWARYCDVLPPRWSLHSMLAASNIAYSVRGHEFDVVDTPDYERLGYSLRPALERHGVGVGKVALSMHGTISTTISLNWGGDGTVNRSLVLEEQMQYQSVDLRYGLSADYLDEWRRRFELESHYLCPLRFLDLPQPTRTRRSPRSPDLLFVGRTEKRKGPDLFVEMAWWLRRGAYGTARIIGPPSHDPHGVSSEHYLRQLIHCRLGPGEVDLQAGATPAELRKRFASRSLVVLPSRYDTFNLVAVESLFSGCPTAIGGGAGVCRFLDETFPDVPYLRIDMDRPLACLPRLNEVLDDYDDYRDRLVDSLNAVRPEAVGPTLAEIYDARPACEGPVRDEAEGWYRLLMEHKPQPTRFSRLRQKAVKTAKAHTSPGFRKTVRSLHPRHLAATVKRAARERLRNRSLRWWAQSKVLEHQARHFAARYHAVGWMPEVTSAQLDFKLHHVGQLVSDLRIDRIRLWREMARLEQLRGNQLVAATYRLRAMRLAGGDRCHDLPSVTRTLTESGYSQEAIAAQAMYAESPERDARCGELLERALSNHRSYAGAGFELVDDRRERSGVRASVIVSLYDAADKLPLFLETLSLQTLLRAGQAEVVLVDSGSPGNEYVAFRAWAERTRLPAVYARSAERESIQAAWNRGIELARGDYLSFLGVDEAILPQTLELLAAELDADRTLDWVQGNSLVTNVDRRGHWMNDIMTYDRSDYDQPLVYLETCYLSWVGSLYRRRIHDRLGYYDPTFGAAGDTEFKNRVLPFIKSRVIPRTLGVFWNYPSGQTTCSPRAEIEDLRAWYLHRTPAGVRYAMRDCDLHVAENLLFSALQYRKSYCRHWSTDVEYAHSLAEFLRAEHPDAAATDLFDGICRLLETYRLLDWLPHISQQSLRGSLEQANGIAAEIASQHRQLSANRIQPVYGVFNDNRHEQHNHVWRIAA
ncbi:MAG TPA: glycosyltransferase [Pirellulales bacterium]|nr:glycosyltransferase [Pirellulales bacterium]